MGCDAINHDHSEYRQRRQRAAKPIHWFSFLGITHDVVSHYSLWWPDLVFLPVCTERLSSMICDAIDQDHREYRQRRQRAAKTIHCASFIDIAHDVVSHKGS